MNKLNFSGSDLGALGGAGFILIGFLILAMVVASRCYEGLGSVQSFRRAAGQTVLAIYANAILLAVDGLWLLFQADSVPSKGEMKFIMFFSLGVMVWQLILLGMAVKNLLASLDQGR